MKKTEDLWDDKDGSRYFRYQKIALNRLKRAGKGTCVISTDYAIGNGLFKQTVCGTIKGFSRDGQSVWVVRSGQKTARSYWPGFWKLED